MSGTPFLCARSCSQIPLPARQRGEAFVIPALDRQVNELGE